MKLRGLSWSAGGLLLAMWLGGCDAAAGHATSHHGQTVGIEARLNCPIIGSSGGRVFLQLAVSTPEAVRSARRPMNLCVVLDRSGSMSEEGKMHHAQAALCALIDRLEEGDLFSLVIYDDEIEVLRHACRVTDRERLKRMVREIEPRGWTNLGGGLQTGLELASRNVQPGYVNRVVLLSDGLANRGITDPEELWRMAARYRTCGVSVSAMGVGLSFNENLMLGLAEQGGGNYYFIESSRNLASVMGKEFLALCTLVARNATVDIRLGSGVCVLDVIGYRYDLEGARLRIYLGDLYGSDRREITLELNVPPGSGRELVAEGKVIYETESPRIAQGGSFRTSIRYSKELAEVDRNRDLEAQGRADVALSTRTVERAMEALDEGRVSDAENALREAKDVLAASPAAHSGAAASLVKAQEEKLDSYQDVLRNESARAKKSIQYDNYRTQKNK